jgi:hypothetical protein
MASTAFSAITALVTGADLTTATNYGATTASEQTCTITAPSGESLDFSRLLIRMRTSAGSAYTNVTLGPGSSYSSIGRGKLSVTVPSAGVACYVGGKDFESARFLTISAQSLIITVATGASAINYEAVLLPQGSTG